MLTGRTGMTATFPRAVLMRDRVPPFVPAPSDAYNRETVPTGVNCMMFSVRLVSRQPVDMAVESWQTVTADQLRAIKEHYDQGKVKAIYRETGVGVLAVYDVADAREMDTIVATMPMSRYFAEVSINALWDMAPVLQTL